MTIVVQNFASSPNKFEIKELTPETISKYESFMPLTYTDDSHTWLQIGCKLIEIAPHGLGQFQTLQECSGGNGMYILNCEVDSQRLTSVKMVKITFFEEATDEDLVRGIFHAHVIKAYSDKLISLPIDTLHEDYPLNVIMSSNKFVEQNIDKLMRSLVNAGWTVGSGSVVLEEGSSCRFQIQ